MNKINELTNFENNTSLNTINYEGKILVYDIHLGKNDPDKKYYELMEIMKNIILATNSSWPSDQEWRNKFTENFNFHFQDFTRAQCQAMMKQTKRSEWNKLPWDFGSWLDAIRARSWKWLGHEKRGKFVKIAIAANSYNESNLEPLEELFIACGCKILRREFIK